MKYLWSVLLLVTLLQAAPNLPGEIYLEIYNRDQALVREIRTVNLEQGNNVIDLAKVTDGMYGSSIQLKPLKQADKIQTSSYSYRYDLLNHAKLIERFLNRWFTFTSDDIVYEGKLLRIDDKEMFLQPDTTDTMIQVVERAKLEEMYYPNIPSDLFTEPIIRWKVSATRALTEVPVEIAYLTSDITWLCDYRAELTGENTLALSGVFVIDNELPLKFENAQIALVAGTTHRSMDPRGGDEITLLGKGTSKAPQKAERFFEYYRYPLDKKLTLEKKQTVLVPFFEPQQVQVEKRFVFPHLLQDGKVRVKIRIDNNDASGLGMSLPEGNVALYQRTPEGSLSFLGEDYITSTPVGKQLELDVGAAFDLSARRLRMTQARPQRDQHEESWQVEIISNRAEPTTVYVEQRVFGYYQVSELEVNGKKIKHEQESADQLVFPVVVPAQSKAVLNYKLTYGY